MATLMVLIPDKLTDLVKKGEVTDRYYNPGNLFDEVHIVTINDDRADPADVQRMVGSARLRLHSTKSVKRMFTSTLAWRPWLLDFWAQPIIELARSIKPALIRCHGAHANAFFASRIKRELGIPYAVSLHINPDEDMRGRAADLKQFLLTRTTEKLERIGLKNADLVLPVYRPIVPYLERLGIDRYEVCYNVLNSKILQKTSYELANPVRILSVGRQIEEKNPDNLIRAVARMANAHLTLIGDGSYHNHLLAVAAEEGISDRVTFHRGISNDELCAALPSYDIFATHSEYWEISKSVLEPLLTGLPVVMNRRQGQPVPELTEDIAFLVENTVESYQAALETLIKDHVRREALGRTAYAHAQATWAPEITEARYVAIYRRLLAGADQTRSA